MEQQYRINVKLRRRGDAALDNNRAELKSESYDSDEDFCKALYDEVLEMLKADRDFLNESEG